jgi:hypothetical protein
MDAPGGTIIAYATAPGSIASDGNGRNGLYTQELLRHMRTPGLDIENVFKQVRISVRTLTQNKQTPWESSSLVGAFYFSPASSDGSRSNPIPLSPAVDPLTVQLAYWESIKNSSNPDDYRAYLEKYPNGEFANLARRRADSLSSARQTPPSTSPNPAKPVESSPIRFDGYYRAFTSTGSAWLRFYEDGTVISVGTVRDATAKKMAEWFKKPYDTAGQYVIRGSEIEFSTTSKSGSVSYTGTIGVSSLKIQWKSFINGKSGYEEYEFIK